MLIANYGGRVPDTMEELLKLGVGHKTITSSSGIFSANRPLCDTHASMSNRLELRREREGPGQVENALKLLDRRVVDSATGWCCSAASTARRAARSVRALSARCGVPVVSRAK